MSDSGETSDVDVLNTSLNNLSLEDSEGVFYASLKNFLSFLLLFSVTHYSEEQRTQRIIVNFAKTIILVLQISENNVHLMIQT